MKALRRLRSRGRWHVAIVACAIALLAIFAPAQALEWDTNLGLPGAQGGSGDWNGGPFWWTGSANINWIDGNLAIFGAAGGMVDASAITVDDIIFNSGSYTLTGGTLTLGLGNNLHAIVANAGATINAALAGTEGFIKAGNGTLTIGSASHNLTGTITIGAGTVAIGSGLDDNALVIDLADVAGAKLQMNDNPFTIGGLSGGGTTGGEVEITGSINVGADNVSRSYAGVLTGTGSFTKSGSGVQTLSNAGSSFTGTTSIQGGALAVPGVADSGVNSPLGAGNTVQLGNATLRYTGTGAVSTNRALTLLANGGAIDVPSATASLAWSGPVSGAASFLVKDGPGELVLSGNNTGFGTVFINAGKLRVAGGSALPDDANVSIGASGTLDLAGSTEAVRAVVGDGATMLGAGKLTVNFSSTATHAGVISGTGGSFEKRGLGTQVLSGANSFSGGIIVADGAVSVPTVANAGSNSPLGANGTITLGDATHTGQLTLSASSGTQTTNRDFALDAAGGAIEVTNAAATLTLTGAIGGAGPLTKLGAGVLALSGNKAYTGATNIQAGTILLGGNIAGSAVTVSAGGTLRSNLNGADIGPFTLAGGTLSPGSVAGVSLLLGTATFTLNSGTFAVDLNGRLSFDLISATGAVTLNGTTALTIALDYDPADFTDVLPIIANDGTDPTVLNGAGARFDFGGNILEEGERFTVTTGSFTQEFEMRYGLTAADNNVRLVAVPEPGAAALLALGLGLLGPLAPRSRSF